MPYINLCWTSIQTKREVINFSFILPNIIITLFQHKFQTGFFIITNTKIYIDDTERKDNNYVCCKV